MDNKKRKFEMELLNSEEMTQVQGGVKVGDVLACGDKAQVIMCQTMEAGCSSSYSPTCNGINKYTACGLSSQGYYLKCTCDYGISTPASSSSSSAVVNTPILQLSY